MNDDNSSPNQVGTQFVLLRLPLKGTEKAPKPVPKAFPDTSAPTPPEPYIDAVLRATDVEAVVRQPRRGGRAAHREAAEPVL